jgi:uncharacterized membrane protein (DUF4010 family)
MDEEFSHLSNEHLFLLIRLLIATGIGFIIGLERQFTKEVKENEEQFAGLRTYTLVSIFGYLCGFLSSKIGAWFFGVGVFCMLALVIVSYIRISTPGNRGGTSEITTLLTFFLGAVVFFNFILFALAITVLVLLLLAYKPNLHGFVNKLKREELLAIIQFVIMSALVMPFLPDTNFGPYDLWNLKDIWKMVILVSGTSLLGYMIAKAIGNKGTVVAGVVGGLVSSTSVTLAYARRTKEAGATTSGFYYLLGIISACTIMFPRILFEVFVVNRSLATKLWLPILLVTAAGFGSAFLIYKMNKGKQQSGDLELKNPLNFATAIKFAIFFALVQWLVKFCSETFGDRGTYVAGALSGLTDVDAITLSMAKVAQNNEGATLLAINTILLAALSNTLIKFILTLSLGSKTIRKPAVIAFTSIFMVGFAYFIYTMFFMT